MAGEGDTERLVVLLEARVKDFEKNMMKASATAGKSFNDMRRGSKQATQGMEDDMTRFGGRVDRLVGDVGRKFQGMGTAFVGGLLGGLAAGGIAGIVSQIADVADNVARVGDEAKRAGLGIKAFQELKYVAEQNRVGVDSLVDGIKELNLRADEWIATGGGAAAEAFTRLGISAEELNEKLQDPSALFTEIIGKIGELDKAAQIRVADEIFGGTGGEKFVQLIEQGADGIRATIDEANALGLVMDAEMIAKADEVDRKFHQIATTVGTSVQSAIVDMTSALIGFIDVQNEAILRNRLLAMDTATTASYQENLSQMAAYLDAAGRVVPELEGEIRAVAEAFEAGRISADEASASLQALASINPEAFPITAGLNGVIGVLELLIGRARDARNELATLSSDPVGGGSSWDQLQNFANPKPKPPRTIPGSYSGGSSGGGGGGGGGRSAAASEADRQAKSINNVIAALRFEREMLQMNELDQAKMTALRQAGIDTTKTMSAEMQGQRAEIEKLVELKFNEQKAYDAATEAQDEYQQQFEMVTSVFGDSIGDLFTGGIKSADEFFDHILTGFADIGNQNLQNGFDKMFANLTSSSPSAANGEIAAADGSWVGANGFAKILGKGVEQGAQAGSAGGIFESLGSLFGGGGQGGNALGTVLSAGAGGLGIGYQAQDPAMGAMGGALQGFMAGGGFTPMGVVGGLVGGLSGPFGPFPAPRPQNDNGPIPAPKEKEVA